MIEPASRRHSPTQIMYPRSGPTTVPRQRFSIDEKDALRDERRCGPQWFQRREILRSEYVGLVGEQDNVRHGGGNVVQRHVRIALAGRAADIGAARVPQAVLGI